MGANIGTSVTNTIVSMGQITNKNDFRRAFAGATVHDAFNWLTVFILLPIEVITGYLEALSKAIIDSIPEFNENANVDKDYLKVITKPLTKLVIQVDKNVIKAIAQGDEEAIGKTIIKHKCCDKLDNGTKVNCGTCYLAILIGAGLTVLVQSSSIFTSSITPLVGMGVLSLDRMYPLTLVSNIGTAATGILAAFAQDGSKIPNALQIALCHLFFNITGIFIFYPIPIFRPPINVAKFLGMQTAKYRWFAFVYLIFAFFLFPAAIFGLSLASWIALAAVMIPIAVVILIVLLIKLLQHKCPKCLPEKMRNWKWLPKPLRSLEPYDRALMLATGNCYCCRKANCMKSVSDEAQERKHARDENAKNVHVFNQNEKDTEYPNNIRL
ncbi:hypothetical protein ACF0H5_011536 [Mactra antiquata]